MGRGISFQPGVPGKEHSHYFNQGPWPLRGSERASSEQLLCPLTDSLRGSTDYSEGVAITVQLPINQHDCPNDTDIVIAVDFEDCGRLNRSPPGWRWSSHIKACMFEALGSILKGREKIIWVWRLTPLNP